MHTGCERGMLLDIRRVQAGACLSKTAQGSTQVSHLMHLTFSRDSLYKGQEVVDDASMLQNSPLGAASGAAGEDDVAHVPGLHGHARRCLGALRYGLPLSVHLWVAADCYQGSRANGLIDGCGGQGSVDGALPHYKSLRALKYWLNCIHAWVQLPRGEQSCD